MRSLGMHKYVLGKHTRFWVCTNTVLGLQNNILGVRKRSHLLELRQRQDLGPRVTALMHIVGAFVCRQLQFRTAPA